MLREPERRRTTGSDFWSAVMPVSRWPCGPRRAGPRRAVGRAGLVVEQVQLRRAAVHEQVDDALRPRREVRQRERRTPPASSAAAGVLLVEQRCQRERSRCRCRAAEELPAGHREPVESSRRAIMAAPSISAGDRLIEVQEDAGGHRPGGQLAGVECGIGGRLADARRRARGLRPESSRTTVELSS